MNTVEQIARKSGVSAALDSIDATAVHLVDLIIQIQQIPAPTFAEENRATFLQRQFKALGLLDVKQDDLHNVYGRYPGSDPGGHPPLVITAHLDTVFPPGTDLSVEQNGRYIIGPGISDNAAGVAGLLWLAQTLKSFNLHPQADIWLVGNVGEEGLGNLRGMQAVVARFGSQARYVVIEGGLFGQVCHRAIGVRRYRVDVNTEGGHSWGAFGNVNAIHVLARIITAIDDLSVPKRPRTTYNVGVIEGGTTVNSIAAAAHMLLDLRSENKSALTELEQQIANIVSSMSQKVTAAKISMRMVGSRPLGHISRQAPLVQWAGQALEQMGVFPVAYIAGSTDANVPLSEGMTAVCIGLAQSGNSHRPDEYLDTTFLPQGLGQFLLLTLAAANL